MLQYVEKVTTVAVFLTALSIIYVCGWSLFHRSKEPQLSIRLQRGEIIASLPRVSYQQASRTLLIAVNSDCSYCRESAPFYKRLSELQTANRSQIIAISPNDEREAREFLQTHDVKVEVVASVDLRKLGITGTPTLVLIDNEGKVNDFWMGALTPEQQEQVVKGLNPPTS